MGQEESQEEGVVECDADAPQDEVELHGRKC